MPPWTQPGFAIPCLKGAIDFRSQTSESDEGERDQVGIGYDILKERNLMIPQGLEAERSGMGLGAG